MSTIVVIPARGGSKRVPGKNLREVGGMTLIERCIRTCNRAQLVDEVLVSTDCPAIATVAASVNGYVIWRPARLATDDCRSAPVVIHALDHRPECKIAVMAQCTAPFMTPDDIDAAIELLPVYDSTLAVVPGEGLYFNEAGECINGRVGYGQTEQLLRCAGSVFVTRKADLVEHDSMTWGRIGKSPSTYPWYCDIDNLADIEEAKQRIVLTQTSRLNQIPVAI